MRVLIVAMVMMNWIAGVVYGLVIDFLLENW
jgi:hypothetical protein